MLILRKWSALIRDNHKMNYAKPNSDYRIYN